MADTTITGANSVVTLFVAGLFPSPLQLSGYSADAAWKTDARELAETQMGVDGRMTAGYVPAPVNQTFSLQGDSPSKSVFKAIQQAMDVAREIYYISGEISLPSTGEVFTCVRGVLVNTKPLPDFGKVLGPMDWTIRWESVTPTLL